MKTILKVIFIIIVGLVISACVNKSFIINEDDSILVKSDETDIVYNGLTLDQLADKLERNLNSTISGYGYVFASKSIELGLDPYLAVSIMLHETGCKWTCSSLMQKCNNVGGMKGTPGCGGGSYKKFDTLEEGIDSFLTMLYNKYYSKGYITPEQIGPKYAEDPMWASRINNYIYQIKNS